VKTGLEGSIFPDLRKLRHSGLILGPFLISRRSALSWIKIHSSDRATIRKYFKNEGNGKPKTMEF